MTRSPWWKTLLLVLLLALAPSAAAQETTVRIHVEGADKPISPDLFGIFFEDLNYAADGGLYAELIENRSFDYSSVEVPDWNALTGWRFISSGGSRGGLAVQDALPVHPNNPTYAVLRCDAPGTHGHVGVENDGFDGIAVTRQAYDFSIFAHRRPGEAGPIQVRLERADGELLASAEIHVDATPWKKHSAVLTPTADEANAKLVITSSTRGMLYLDMVSLFPRHTFRDRPNGLRADLAEAIADLKPRFMRFPGGCLVHGDGLRNIYNWKDTIGPVEQRKPAKNIWRYHQSFGLGYFEYFQFCADIGAAPLPIIAAGVSCQNSDLSRGTGQQCIPMADMPAYIQDVLDLIEYANGPVTSKWGAQRAAAGHPEPFNLKYLGVGNEDAITPGFSERFKMIFEAVRAKHPDITVIGTVGPAAHGRDFDEGWKIANELNVPIVDEHYYVKPDWFWDNLGRYDAYDRSKSKVYLGEYAAHDQHRKSTWRAALAEAAYMTQLERNGDVVTFASYAPLLSKRGRTQWLPDLIYFDNTTVCLSASYFVQQLFGHNAGDASLPTSIDTDSAKSLAASCVRDSKTGDVILKIVSRRDVPVQTTIDLTATGVTAGSARCTVTVLAGEEAAENLFGKPPVIAPTTTTLNITPRFNHELPARSLTVLRIPTRR